MPMPKAGVQHNQLASNTIRSDVQMSRVGARVVSVGSDAVVAVFEGKDGELQMEKKVAFSL